MKRKLLLLLVALLPMIASAYQAQIDGIYYDFSGDNATVTYKKEFSQGYSGEVVIPESVAYDGKTYSVTSIGQRAFYGCTGLTSVTIPNSVTSIGYSAFNVCYNLTSITIGNSVTSIGYYAFQNCYGLTSITIPNSVTSIGDYAFQNCFSLTSIQVETGNTTYDSRDNCNAIIETATNTLIAGCQNTTIPNGVTSIGGSAFSYCKNLTSITIPNSVTSIGDSVFYNCTSLTSITIGNSVTSIGGYAFRDCTSLTSITIPNSVTSIGGYAFRGCASLTSITIPDSVTEISWYTFQDCTSLTSITIPNSVTYIGDGAFAGCTSLTAITIGTGIKDIGSKAFINCNGLTDVYCFAENVPRTGSMVFASSSIGSATLHVPASSISSYSTTQPWSKFGKIVSLVAEDAVTEVKALPILIQSNRGIITVQGANEGTEVSVFSVNGMKQGSAIATNGLATIYTSLHPGSTAIVKIGEKAIKVMVK